MGLVCKNIPFEVGSRGHISLETNQFWQSFISCVPLRPVLKDFVRTYQRQACFVPTASICQAKTPGTTIPCYRQWFSEILWKCYLYINIYLCEICSVLCEDGQFCGFFLLLLPEMAKLSLVLNVIVHRIFVILFS